MERKLRDLQLAEKVEKIAEKDVNLAEKVVRSFEDREAKIFGFLTLFKLTRNPDYLKDAVEMAETDEDYLMIVERSEEALPEIAEMIESSYRKNLAYCVLLEKTGDLNLTTKISDVRLLSASLKRVAMKRHYPESLRVARMIPDPYYRALALMELGEKERIDLKDEIAEAVKQVDNAAMRRRLEEKMKKNINSPKQL